MFKYRVWFPCTKKQIDEIRPELDKLGYDSAEFTFKGDEKFMCTNYYHSSKPEYQALLTSYHKAGDNNQVSLGKYNKELILALAVMREDEDFYVGESVIRIDNDHLGGGPKIGEFTTVTRGASSRLSAFYDDDDSVVITKGDHYSLCSVYRKATKEEIIAHYTKLEVKCVVYTGSLGNIDTSIAELGLPEKTRFEKQYQLITA